MGMYICCECDQYRDSDNGYYECPEHQLRLVCPDCWEEFYASAE